MISIYTIPEVLNLSFTITENVGIRFLHSILDLNQLFLLVRSEVIYVEV